MTRSVGSRKNVLHSHTTSTEKVQLSSRVLDRAGILRFDWTRTPRNERLFINTQTQQQQLSMHVKNTKQNFAAAKCRHD